jgi:hypothetical protein
MIYLHLHLGFMYCSIPFSLSDDFGQRLEVLNWHLKLRTFTTGHALSADDVQLFVAFTCVSCVMRVMEDGGLSLALGIGFCLRLAIVLCLRLAIVWCVLSSHDFILLDLSVLLSFRSSPVLLSVSSSLLAPLC